ncbi:MAG: cupin domain-containing protein [Pseudomonadota bacterium]
MKAERFSSAAIVAATALALSTKALSACPEEHIVEARDVQGPEESVGVSIRELALVNISPVLAGDVAKRFFELTVAPGGHVLLHGHGDVQGYAYVLSGEATERRSDCAVALERRAGDVATEPKTLSHWWENTGPDPLILLVSHAVPAQN